jgi:hypothetical protein
VPGTRRPPIEEPVRQDLTVKDVPPGESEAGLQIARAEHQPMLDQVAESRRVVLHSCDDAVADRLAEVIPIPIGGVVRCVLGKDRQGVFAGGCKSFLARGLNPRLAEEAFGYSTLRSSGACCLQIVDGGSNGNHAEMFGPRLVSGRHAAPARESRKRAVDLYHRALRREQVDVLKEIARE